MTNDNRFKADEIILGLVSPPFLVLLLNLFRPFLGYSRIFNNESVYMDVENHHILGYWIWLWLIPYALLFVPEFKKGTSIMVQIPICLSASIAFWDVFVQEYSQGYIYAVLFFAGAGLFFLYLDFFQAESWVKLFEKFIPKKDPYSLKVGSKSAQAIPTESLHMNVEIVGGTGSGKTHFVLKPFIEQTITQGLGCFIYDVKGNMDSDIGFYVHKTEKEQCRSISLYHFNLNNYQTSHTYNPLYGDDPDAIANRLHTALYYDTRHSEPYYVELAEMFLKNIIALLKKHFGVITFQDLLLATQETDTFRSIQALCAENPNSPQAFYFRTQWLQKPAKQRREELLGLINKLQRFCNSEWAPLINVRTPNITMKDVFENDKVFLFSPNAARYPEDAKALSIMAMMDLSEQVANRYYKKPEKPFRVFLDEFYNLAYPRFIDFINKCREAQVNIILAHQSLGDLRGISNEFMEQVMNTARNKIILGLDDPETAEYFARQIGTEPDKNYKVESYGKDGTMMGYSKPQVEKFIFHPNQIKGLKTGQAVVKVVGPNGPNIFTVKLNPATQNPITANFYISPRRRDWDKTNESGLAEYMKRKLGFEGPNDDNLGSLMGK